MSEIHPYHAEIIRNLERAADQENAQLQPDGSRYVGTRKPFYPLKSAVLRQAFRDFSKSHADLTIEEFEKLLDSLSLGRTYNEYVGIGLLLGEYPKLRAALEPACLERWLDQAEGWAEVDVICSLNFTSEEMLSNWDAWEEVLQAFARSENIHKRRASLVLLVRPLRTSADERLERMSFANIDLLKAEKEILITKAVSWLLRSLIKFHRAAVEAYLEANAPSLPNVAVRETRNKLVGGVKKKR